MLARYIGIDYSDTEPPTATSSPDPYWDNQKTLRDRHARWIPVAPAAANRELVLATGGTGIGTSAASNSISPY